MIMLSVLLDYKGNNNYKLLPSDVTVSADLYCHQRVNCTLHFKQSVKNKIILHRATITLDHTIRRSPAKSWTSSIRMFCTIRRIRLTYHNLTAIYFGCYKIISMNNTTTTLNKWKSIFDTFSIPSQFCFTSRDFLNYLCAAVTLLITTVNVLLTDIKFLE